MTAVLAPSAAGLPVIGSLLDLQRDSLNAFLRAQRDHGDVVRFVAGPPGLRVEFYGVFSAEGTQQVLATDSVNFRKDNKFYLEVQESVGDGLLTSQDDDYVRQRRLVQPLFTRRRVDTYAATMCEEASAAVERWRTAPGQVVDLLAEATGLTLRTVSRILFGADVEAAVDVVRRSFPVVADYTRQRGFAPANLPRHWPTPGNRRAAAAQRELNDLCDEIIARRRDQPGGGTAVRGDDGIADLLGLLADATDGDGDRLSAGEVRDQVLLFLLAGHETTATSVAFALHLLARHPDAQAAAREEVDRVLGTRRPGADDLDALPYVTKVLKEAMRLYPAAPAIGRRAVADTEVDGYRVPAGANVFVSPWVTHRNPAYWDDPERFDPERFSPEAEAARPRYAWFPFGGGPRACIGQRFSMLESVLAVAIVLQAYELAAIDTDVSLSLGITLRAAGPLRCRLTAR
ncbi:Cytochrome P450 [Actinopolymorpha cephalotaxi]|uniref:Cytochrome P450 n=1 Tax=Actinopolymorpha cephalotaxi TaxID=504797 RepID=A0A1I3A9D2_9ACTN|nr:cytochrome P450 [Actinopolymorpha cephalotaxi]NYH85265.1 cytochrome P450 [Actinopolymorpha cephalotaxi]SFH46717.1 Cytochrome P450 [Actinopolymorpha cephalotaxi]